MAGFLDLPVEIRCIIYNQIGLKADYEIDIRSTTPFIKRPKRLRLITPWKLNLDMSIIFVNKEINAESSSILYAVNVFSFTDIFHLIKFLERLGPLAQHVRHVGYPNVARKSELKRLVTLLEPAKHLSSLTMGHQMIDIDGKYKACKPKHLVKLLEPLREALREARKDQIEGKNSPISEIVYLRPTDRPPHLSSTAGMSLGDIFKESDAVNEEFKALVAK